MHFYNNKRSLTGRFYSNVIPGNSLYKYMLSMLFALLFLGTVTAVPGGTTKHSKKKEIEQSVTIYRNAMEIHDYTSAAYALHVQIAGNENDTASMQELLGLYFNYLKNFESAYMLSKKMLDKDRNNLNALEYFARSSEQLNKFSEAYLSYEKMYYITDSIIYGYLTVANAYNSFRIKDGFMLLTSLLNRKDVGLYTIEISYAENMAQTVPLKAALYNIKALLLYEQQDYKAAKLAFQEALNVFPDFKLVQNNLKTYEFPE